MRLVSAAALATSFALLACSNEVIVVPGDGGSGGTSDGGAPTKNATSVVGTSVASTGTGIGEPSDVYPAPHPDPPQVVDLGGAKLTSPKIVPVLFASDDSTIKNGVPIFTQQVAGSSYWSAIGAEYGIGPATALPPVMLSEPPGSFLDDSDIQAWLAGKLDANDPAFPAPDANTLYAIFYPFGTTITLDNGDGSKSTSCQEFGGYHLSTSLDAAHGHLEVAYAVIPQCGFFGTGVDDVSGPASHEYIEAATDAHPYLNPAYAQTDDNHIYYAFLLGAEVADLCAQESDAFDYFPGIDNLVQRSWSNAAAKAGHDPCVPAPQAVYFNAAPVMKDQLSFGQGFDFKGVQIAEGESKTIDVALFSDGPTNGPFYVDAYDPGLLGGSLSFDFDENEGQNGQTLHLTITVDQESQYGFETFLLTSSLDGVTHSWMGIVGN
jgi:hypothetical protein